MEFVFFKVANFLKLIYSFLLKFQISKTGFFFNPDFPMIIKNGKAISIGNNFSSNGSVRLYADSGEILIGDNNSFNSNVFIGASGGKIIIGSNVLIGPNSVLRASDHQFCKNKLIKDQGHISGIIVIEDDVWLGANVVVLKDVIIRKGSVIGAGSVVTKSTEEYSINVGVPAKQISQRN
jgi:acetyltransferase-like isoleucine patch superfamily enzyme